MFLRKSIRSVRFHSTIIYIDGSCLGHGMPDCRAGIGIYWGPNDARNKCLRINEVTSPRVELHAARFAIKQARSHGIKSIVLRTDSSYLCNSLNQWLEVWKKNGFKLSNRKPVKNLDLLLDLEKQIQDMDVTFEWVQGHSGDPGNEFAHELAQVGAKSSNMEKFDD